MGELLRIGVLVGLCRSIRFLLGLPG